MNLLHSMNGIGNVHEMTGYINRNLPELIDHVVSIEFKGGNYNVTLFRAPKELIDRLKSEGRI